MIWLLPPALAFAAGRRRGVTGLVGRYHISAAAVWRGRHFLWIGFVSRRFARQQIMKITPTRSCGGVRANRSLRSRRRVHLEHCVKHGCFAAPEGSQAVHVPERGRKFSPHRAVERRSTFKGLATVADERGAGSSSESQAGLGKLCRRRWATAAQLTIGTGATSAVRPPGPVVDGVLAGDIPAFATRAATPELRACGARRHKRFAVARWFRPAWQAAGSSASLDRSHPCRRRAANSTSAAGKRAATSAPAISLCICARRSRSSSRDACRWALWEKSVCRRNCSFDSMICRTRSTVCKRKWKLIV